MRDIYKTAKKAQTTPVRGRVKAMLAQPRAVAQARKIARQTTGFQKGGITDSPTKVINRLLSDEKGKPHSTTEGKEASIKRLTKRVLDRYIKKGQQQGLNPGDVRSALDLVGSSKGSFKDFLEKAKKKQAGGTVKPMSHNSELTKWFLEQHGGTQKGKPHSTRKGRIAAGKRALRRGVEEFERKRKKRRMGPVAPPRPRPKAGPPAGRPKAPGGGIPGLPRPKARPPATREYQDPRDRFKKKKKEEPGMDVKKGGVMEKGKPHSTKEGRVASMYRQVKRSRDKDRISVRDMKRVSASAQDVVALHEKLKKETPRGKGKAKAKKHKEKLKKLAEKGIGYIQGWVGKKKGGKVKRGCANGGTVVMPTVGNDVRVRAYKQGALIHPRPRPTTVLHGRPRGVGIAKRGW